VIGANMADCHPILFLRMMDRVKAGAKLIVVDPRRNATADKADLFLQVKPGSDLALMNGLLHLLHADGRTNPPLSPPHAGLGGHAGLPGRLSPRQAWPRSPASPRRIAPRRRHDRRGGRMDELLDHGPQPEHPWHLEHQCHLQSASGHRRDLPPRQRPLSLTGQPNAMGGREMGYMGPACPASAPL
jgi:sulfite reductase (NADPH) flavoprotein alpha-component